MTKQILPHELAEIVTGLLVSPDILAELDSPEKHQAFMLDIGRVVAEHCGGEVNHVNESDTDENYLSDQYSSPYLSVSPDENLPSLLNNVWAYHDPEGWEEEFLDCDSVPAGVPVASTDIESVRGKLQTLLSHKALTQGESLQFIYNMADWRLSVSEPVKEDGDDQKYNVATRLGNQNGIEILDEKNNPILGMLVEINQGVPALHLEVNGGDALLHVHKVGDGLVLTPDNNDIRFEQAEADRYSYNDPRSLVIR